MKNLLITLLLFIPFLVFGQLSRSEKVEVEKYTLHVCECTDSIFATTDPLVVDFMIRLGDNQEEGLIWLEDLMLNMTDQETETFMANMNLLQEPEFIESMDNCISNYNISDKVKNGLEIGEGEYYSFFKEAAKVYECKLILSLLNIAESTK